MWQTSATGGVTGPNGCTYVYTFLTKDGVWFVISNYIKTTIIRAKSHFCVSRTTEGQTDNAALVTALSLYVLCVRAVQYIR